MFTEQHLASFGNFLFQRYNVQVHSTDGKNTPLYQREVGHADIESWKSDNSIGDKAQLPSRYQIGDKALFYCPKNEGPDAVIPVPCEIGAVHFYEGKVKYDLWLTVRKIEGDSATKIYNVDSAFIGPVDSK